MRAITIWTCTTDGDGMPRETIEHTTFEEAAQPCREALEQMEWESRHGAPLDTASDIAVAWRETFRGDCIIVQTMHTLH